MPLWKNGAFVEDSWSIVPDDAVVPGEGDVMVSLDRWRKERATLAERNASLGLVLAPGSLWTDILGDLPRFPVIAVTIPKYADGRAFSIARLLRDRDGYTGEIRAVGDYIVDQIPLMRRVGIDAFVVANPVVEKALATGAFAEVTDYLQPAFGTTEIPAGTRPWARKKAAPKT